MRVNSVNLNCCPKPTKYKNFKTNRTNVSFEGKHTAAKVLGSVMGTLGTLGAIGGTIIMTGGVVLPAVIAYGALCAGGGALIGHECMDKYEQENNNSDK